MLIDIKENVTTENVMYHRNIRHGHIHHIYTIDLLNAIHAVDKRIEVSDARDLAEKVCRMLHRFNSTYTTSYAPMRFMRNGYGVLINNVDLGIRMMNWYGVIRVAINDGLPNDISYDLDMDRNLTIKPIVLTKEYNIEDLSDRPYTKEFHLCPLDFKFETTYNHPRNYTKVRNLVTNQSEPIAIVVNEDDSVTVYRAGEELATFDDNETLCNYLNAMWVHPK